MKFFFSHHLLLCLLSLVSMVHSVGAQVPVTEDVKKHGRSFRRQATSDTFGMQDALLHAQLVNEGFNRCVDYVNAWMAYADPVSGLIPRNIRESADFWNAWDAAADNYPYMVLVSAILMPDFFRGQAVRMLDADIKLTSRIGALPDNYSFSKKGFQYASIDTNRIIFGSAEYMKDGLIPLTEWLGKSRWSDRMLDILDDLPKLVRVASDLKGNWYGNSATVEVNGDLLQVLSRMYWFTGKREYLDRAVEIADHYLHEGGSPTRVLDRLRIRDHGCEIISGLCEAYIAAYYALPAKRAQWRPHIHEMLERILEVGRNADGLFYDEINPKTGEILSSRLADNFGYTLNAYWFIAKIDTIPAFREAVLKAMSSLNARYRNHDWEGSADGYADAIEGALNLYNREPIPSVKLWLDSEIRVMWDFQKAGGMVEGWHGDGNFARTTIMYCLWKTQGIVPVDWEKDLHLGAVAVDGGIKVVMRSPSGWKGKIRFDAQRHKSGLNLPADYPRINQFPEWYTVEADKKYRVTHADGRRSKTYSGRQLLEGISVRLKKNETVLFMVRDQDTEKPSPAQ